VAYSLDIESKIKEILSSVEVSKVEVEGPSICIYIKNPANLSNEEVAELAKTLKKRIVVRSDASARLSKKDAEKAILSLAPDLVEHIHFEDAGDVYVYLSRAVPERGFQEACEGDLLVDRLARHNRDGRAQHDEATV